MGLAIAIFIAVIGAALVGGLLWGLWHVRMPTFGSRVRRGRAQSYDKSSGEWVDEYPLRHPE